MGHENKCANLHGHNYVALLEAEAESLDSIGRVVDFSVLKERIGGWIEQEWDHGFLVYMKDEQTIKALDQFDSWDLKAKTTKVALLPCNPTAENMAWYLLEYSNLHLLQDLPISLRSVTIWETENCFAVARHEV